MTRKRKYEKPSMKVHELKHRTQLLVGSDTSKGGQFDPYQPGNFSW